MSDLPRVGGYLVRVSTKEEAGRRIAAARKAKGLRLEDVEKKVPEFSVSRLSNWEQGRNMIGVDEAKRLGPVLGVNPAYLLTLDDDPSDPREKALLDYFRRSDERGRAQILGIAQSQPQYTIEPNDDAKAA